ncbi:MAG: hypothetical protein IT370_02435 [Deltaproteobacteria bacterium]|nr:hypothetical protein [Deltaproteobacteria bacterium]
MASSSRRGCWLARLLAGLLLAAGCGGRRAPAHAPLASTRPSPVADVGPALPPEPAVAAVDAGAPAVDPALARCLAAGDLHAVITLASGTPDCSGVGHEHLVFTVAAGPPGLERASLSCQLGVGCRELEGVRRYPGPQDGSVWIATLTPDLRPARTVYCVALPATQASVRCGVPVPDVATGQRLLAAALAAR